MSKLWGKFGALFRSRTYLGIDKSGNRYYARTEQIDGVLREKRWVEFKGEQDPTSIPVEWICWLNGQRKIAPTLEEMAELEARRERVRLRVAVLKEEEEKRGKAGKAKIIGKSVGPDLKSFIEQYPEYSEGKMTERASDSTNVGSDESPRDSETTKEIPHFARKQSLSSEPTGSGETYRPGTWQP